MAEDFLYGGWVRAGRKEVGGHGVPQGVGRDVRGNARQKRIFFDEALDCPRRERGSVSDIGFFTVVADKKSRGVVGSRVEVSAERLARAFGHKHDADFIALSPHGKLLFLRIDLVALQGGELRDAESRREEDL